MELTEAIGLVTAMLGAGTLFYNIGKKQASSADSVELNRYRTLVRTRDSSIVSLSKALTDAKGKLQGLRSVGSPPAEISLSGRLVELLSNDEQEFWLTIPPEKPLNHDAILQGTEKKIIAIANLKGGVAKTTTTSNLAAYFDRVMKKRVLVIDADYQGSLSTILMAVSKTVDFGTKTVDWLNNSNGKVLPTPNRVGDKLPRTDYLTAFYELQNVETKLQMEWLINALSGEKTEDLRYRLADALFRDNLVDQYDVILIDCPPRLSTATINALATCTHILVPSVPDTASLEAAANFSNMARKITAQLNPSVRFMGLAPMMSINKNLNDEEKERLRMFSENATNFGEDPYIFSKNIPRSKPIADLAGTSIVVLDGAAAQKKMFEQFGEEVSTRLGAGFVVKS